jgi:hypothetical protein
MIQKITAKLLVWTLCTVGFCFTATAQDIQVLAKIAQGSIRIGNQTTLRLSVVQPKKEQVTFPVLADTLTGKVDVVGSSRLDTIADQNDPNRITVTKSITITGFDEGTYTVPALTFTTATGPLKTSEQTLVVQGVKVDTTKAIYDIKQPLAVTYTWVDWLKDNWAWVVFPLLGVLLLAGLLYYYWKRPKSPAAPEKPIPTLPIHTLALNKLNELRDKKLWQQDAVKQYYSELSEVMREYLEKRYAIKTYEKTTEEIFASLKRLEIDAEQKRILHQLLVLSDLVKFAKEKPLPVENEQSMEQAIGFVIKTQQVVVQPVKTEGGIAGE